MSQVTFVIFLLLLAAVLIGIGPILTIASLNTLFGLNIAYTFWTWLSTVWLQLITFGGLNNAIRSLKK